VKIKSIFHSGVKPKNGEIPIYHVHGFLPENQKLNENHSITLSESIYHQQYLDVYSWNNIVQLNKFTDKVCLFIGSSFTDPNIRRLMDIAKKQRGNIGKHYIIKRKICIDDIEEKVIMEIEKNKDGLNNNYQIHLSDLIKKIIEMNELLEEKDANSFGAEIIWVDNYENDIPKILSSIQQQKTLNNFS
ncbi:MAG: SIR2 family protein, partial [Clostridiales bacterium]|nr:SIR2 family protein [Clostridiales bacterium]